jgi:hypothetical protein
MFCSCCSEFNRECSALLLPRCISPPVPTEMYFANRRGRDMNVVHVGFGSRTPAAREDM